MDLNRNHDFKWGLPGASHGPCSLTYAGARAASEPETQAYEAFVRSLFEDRRARFVGDTLTINGTGVDDHFAVDPTNGGSGGHVSNDAPKFDYDGATQVTTNGGGGGYDVLTVQGTEGDDTVTSTGDLITIAGQGSVTIGDDIDRMDEVIVGGESTMPFLKFEGEIPRRPVVAIEIQDHAPDWSPGLLEAWGTAVKDPVAWAKKAEEIGPMNRNDFHEILNTCIALEELAIKTYKKLEKHTDPAMHALWKRMSLDETAHLKYWKSLLTLAEKHDLLIIADECYVEIWRTAPYLHDGSAATLRDVLTRGNPNDQHGRTSQLDLQEIDDLVEYLLTR